MSAQLILPTYHTSVITKEKHSLQSSPPQKNPGAKTPALDTVHPISRHLGLQITVADVFVDGGFAETLDFAKQRTSNYSRTRQSASGNFLQITSFQSISCILP